MVVAVVTSTLVDVDVAGASVVSVTVVEESVTVGYKTVEKSVLMKLSVVYETLVEVVVKTA